MKSQNKLQAKKKIKNMENETTEIDTAISSDVSSTELTYDIMPHGMHYAEATGLIATDAILATTTATTAENIALITPDILFSIDEERMARDIYDALYVQTGLKIFDSISDSEQKHYDAVLNSAINLGIDTSALLTTPGTYLNPEIQALYDDLMALGSQSTADALTVGKMIEEVDIADLKEMIDTSPITSLDSVYTNLLNASYNHLDAFNAQIAII